MHLSSTDLEDIIHIMNKNLQIFLDSTPNYGPMVENSLMYNSNKVDSFCFCDWNCEIQNQLLLKQKKFDIKIVKDVLQTNLNLRLSFYFINKIDVETIFLLTELEFSKCNDSIIRIRIY